MGNYWSATPCDAAGNSVANLTSDGNGYYGMTSGIETESVSNTYPVAMVAAAVANPGTYGDYLQSAFPLGISPSLQTFSLPINVPYPVTVLGGNFGEGNAAAYNYVSRGSGAYTYSVPSSQGPPLTGPINGSLTKDLTGQLRFYWRVQWMGMGAPTIPMPDHLNLCVKASLTATASVSYNSSVQRSGLSAKATASDQVGGIGFGDAVSASAGDTGTLPGSSVTKYHLVSASVLPLAGSTTTGIAQAYLNGSTHTFVNNTVPYLVPGTSPVLNGQTQAYASVTVVGGVRQDNRIVWISSPIEASYYKGSYDSVNKTDRYLHQRDSITGAIAVDAVANFSMADRYLGAGAWEGHSSFYGNTSLITNPTYSWSSDFDPIAMIGVDLTQQSVPGAWTFYLDKILPLTKVVTLTVQDGIPSDCATAANTYAVTWHRPFENWSDCKPAVTEEIDTIAPSSVPSGISGAQVAYADQTFLCDFEFGANQMADGIVATQKILPVTQPFFGPIWQSLIGAAGQPFDKALLGVTLSHNVTNDTDAFTEATYLTSIGLLPLVPRDINGAILPHEKYKMTGALLSAHYKRRFLQGDGYDSHGYVGPKNNTSRTVFKVQATGKYEIIQILTK